MDPDTHQQVVKALIDTFGKVKGMGFEAVYLVSPQIRSVMFTLLEREIPNPVVLSYNEVSKAIKVSVIASALMPSAETAER